MIRAPRQIPRAIRARVSTVMGALQRRGSVVSSSDLRRRLGLTRGEEAFLLPSIYAYVCSVLGFRVFRSRPPGRHSSRYLWVSQHRGA